MRIVIDASAILAVLLNQEQRDSIVGLTVGATLIAPGSLHWEIGNALSSLMKRKKLGEKDALIALDDYSRIPIQFEHVDLKSVLPIVQKHLIYAYDAYMIFCAKSFRIPLLTLGNGMAAVAEKEKVKVLEV